MKRILALSAAIAVTTLIFGTIFVVAQQITRSSADDAPLRLASQVASEIRGGQSATLAAQPHVDLSRSLAPFVVIQDAQGRATEGSGYLNDHLVSLPTGVLSATATTGRQLVSWQPTPGLRFATVTLEADGRFVSAGQSLAPTEQSEADIRLLVGLSWLAAELLIAGYWQLSRRMRMAS